MRTIVLSDEDYKKVQEVLAKAEPVVEKKKGVTIYKTNGSVLFESDKETIKEAVVERVNSGADLYEANLYGADLRGADLYEADLRGANLHWADLRGADLRGANLHWADIRGADLYEADLRGANLHWADLRGADLYEADLRGAELDSAKFYGKGGTTKIKKSQLNDFLKALGIIVEDN